MAMAVIPLAPVVEPGPITVVERDKGKPVHRVAQMLVTGKTKVYNTTFATGFGHRYRSRLGLKMTRGLPATLGIAEFGPDRRHQGSAFTARQRLGKLSGRARGEKTLDPVVIDLHRFDRSPKLLDEDLDQLGLGSDHMLGHRKLRFIKLLPQLLTALFTEMMLLGGKAVELFTCKRTEMSRGRIPLEKIQGVLSFQVLKDLQGPGIILFERGGELIEKPSFVAHHSALIPTKHFKLLSFLRARSQRSQVRLIGSEKLRQHIGIKRIALRDPSALNGKLALYRSSKRGLLSIEPVAPFSYWPGQSLPDPRKRDRVGLVLNQQALEIGVT